MHDNSDEESSSEPPTPLQNGETRTRLANYTPNATKSKFIPKADASS